VSSLSEEAIKTTGTIALCKYNRLMVTSPRALVRGYEWQDTITHEFTHFLVTRKSRNTVPIWIHEGIAKYEETRWRGKAGLALDPGGEALLARAVKQDKLITFERMHPSMALLPSQEDAATAFAEVFTAIQFVDEKVGMAGVRAIIDALKAGKSDREAVGGALGTSFEKFESSWKQALRARPAPKVAPGFEKMVFKDDPKKDSKEERKKAYEQGELGTLPNAEARKYAHLGELFRARQRNGPAALEYEKAIALAGPTHPALARKYALVMIDLGRNPEAQKVLEQSLAVFPDEETNHLLLGDLLAKAGRGAEAKTHLLIANQRDPFDADIHELLAQVAKAEKDAGLLAREQDVLKILKGEKLTWRAAQPGAVAALAYLRIEAPAGAKVLVDGVDTGLTTPVQEHPVTSGKHVVRLELPDGKSVEHTVEFAPDEIVPFPQT
jgi:tetratricopeptide (TPR) repeat protein